MPILRYLFFCCVLLSCRQDAPFVPPPPGGQAPVIRYVAIGDSYTIGEGASPQESFPAVLTRRLQQAGLRIELVANPARTGWTSQMAIDYQLPVYDNAQPGFATLLIGVNDWVREVDAATFRTNLALLMDRMLARLPNNQRLIVVTIPDFSVTPRGKDYGNGRDISAGIAAFNRIISEEARQRQLSVADVFEVSRQIRNDPGLLSADGLHPSAKMYALWADLIFPLAFQQLK